MLRLIGIPVESTCMMLNDPEPIRSSGLKVSLSQISIFSIMSPDMLLNINVSPHRGCLPPYRHVDVLLRSPPRVM